MSANPWWYDVLAVVPYAGLATWSLVVAGAFYAAVRVGGLSRHLLWGVAAFVLLAVYFFSVAITGGATPLIPRRQLAVPIRLLAVTILIVGGAWIVLWAREHIVIEHHGRIYRSHHG